MRTTAATREAESHARKRAESLIERVRLASASGGPVERAQAATAEAEYARAIGAGDTGGRARSTADLWVAAAAAWEALARPYPVAYARWREAEALLAARDREGAARAASEALATARRLGSAWLAEEVESLAARARLQLGADGAAALPSPRRRGGRGPVRPDTARARRARRWWPPAPRTARSASSLHMAEKTASVHVSRILAKLNVRSRTEAAAVAHRQGLVPTA